MRRLIVNVESSATQAANARTASRMDRRNRGRVRAKVRRGLASPRLYVPLILAGAAGWGYGAAAGDWEAEVLVGHCGGAAKGDGESLCLLVRRGYPSREWAQRGNLRAI